MNSSVVGQSGPSRLPVPLEGLTAESTFPICWLRASEPLPCQRLRRARADRTIEPATGQEVAELGFGRFCSSWDTGLLLSIFEVCGGARGPKAPRPEFLGLIVRAARPGLGSLSGCLTIASEGREAWAAYCPCAAFSLVWFCWRDLVSGWTGGEAERETIDGHVYLEEFIALGFRGAPDLLDGREAGWRGRGRFFGVERMRLELVERRRGLLRRVLSSSLTRT